MFPIGFHSKKFAVSFIYAIIFHECSGEAAVYPRALNNTSVRFPKIGIFAETDFGGRRESVPAARHKNVSFPFQDAPARCCRVRHAADGEPFVPSTAACPGVGAFRKDKVFVYTFDERFGVGKKKNLTQKGRGGGHSV